MLRHQTLALVRRARRHLQPEHRVVTHRVGVQHDEARRGVKFARDVPPVTNSVSLAHGAAIAG